MKKKTSDKDIPASDEPMYLLDFEIIESEGRDIKELIASRQCAACKSAPAKSDEISKKGKEIDRLRKQIQTQCVKETDYLGADLPVQELAFRMLLASRKPMSLTACHEWFSDFWVKSASPRHIGREALERVLGYDSYYGIVLSA